MRIRLPVAIVVGALLASGAAACRSARLSSAPAEPVLVSFPALDALADEPPVPAPEPPPPSPTPPPSSSPPTPTPPSTTKPGTPASAEGAAPAETPGTLSTESSAVPAAEPKRFELVPETVPMKPAPTGVFRRMPSIASRVQCASPFVRDMDLRLHLRSFYFNRHNVDGSDNEAWAFGGWLQYTSGWWRDAFSIGLVGYTSQPLYAPEDRDGTSLLATGQEEITVLGQAFARVRYKDYAMLTAFRQSVNDGYVNPQDNRMIPNTFEGMTLKGKIQKVGYGLGYLWEMKPRNRDHFIAMSDQAGAGGDDGVWYGSVALTPGKGWETFTGDYYTPDVFNTFFASGKHVRPLSSCLEGQFGAQFTDQRSVGDERLGDFQTWNFGIGGRLVWATGLTLGTAFHATGDDASIRTPYGTWPGYLSLIETDFDRANEKAWGVGVRYDFGKSRGARVPGLLAVFAYAHGWDREDGSGGGLPDTDEIDFDVTYDVPSVKGLQLRLRSAWVEAGGEDDGFQVRLIANYEIDLW